MYKSKIYLLFITFLFSNGLLAKKTNYFSEIEKQLIQARYNNDYDSSLVYLTLLRDRAIEEHNIKKQLRVEFQVFNTFLIFEKDREALKIGLSLFSKYEKGHRQDPYYHWVIINYLSNYMINIGNYKHAVFYLQSYQKSASYQKTKNERSDFLLAKTYIKMGLPESATNVMLNFIDDIEADSYSSAHISAYNQIGYIYQKLNQPSKAIEYYRKSIVLIDSLQLRPKLKPVILGNIGECYFLQKNYDLAYSYFELDAKGSFEYQNMESYKLAVIQLSKIDMINKNLTKSRNRILDLLHNDSIQLELVDKVNCYSQLIKIDKENGDLKSLNANLNTYTILSDSFHLRDKYMMSQYVNLNAQNNYRDIKKTLDIEKWNNQKEQKLLGQKIDLEKRNTVYLTLIFIIILLSILFILRKVIIERKKELIIKRQEIKIREQNLKIKESERLQLEREVIQRNQRISNQALELEIKKASAEKIIDKIKSSITISNSDLMGIKLFINNELDIKSVRGQVNNLIGDIGENFIENLKLKHKNLTDKEVKLAVLVTLKLSNKEIGLHSNLGSSTVKNNRNRLKKKLLLNPSEKLIDYLNNFH